MCQALCLFLAGPGHHSLSAPRPSLLRPGARRVGVGVSCCILSKLSWNPRTSWKQNALAIESILRTEELENNRTSSLERIFKVICLLSSPVGLVCPHSVPAMISSKGSLSLWWMFPGLLLSSLQPWAAPLCSPFAVREGRVAFLACELGAKAMCVGF